MSPDRCWRSTAGRSTPSDAPLIGNDIDRRDDRFAGPLRKVDRQYPVRHPRRQNDRRRLPLALAEREWVDPAPRGAAPDRDVDHAPRPDTRRYGNEGVSTCRFRVWPD